MRTVAVGRRAVTSVGVGLIVLGTSLVAVAGLAPRASASGYAITVSPHSHLKAGRTLLVRGRGFAHGSNGAILECNDSPGEPAVIVAVHAVSHVIGVGCTDPVPATTSENGRIRPTRLTLAGGTLGTWEPGTDSAGNPATADSAAYPCPPTTAQAAVGISCLIEFIDNRGQVATHTVAFAGTHIGRTTTTTSTSSTTSTTTTTTTMPICTPVPVTVNATAGGGTTGGTTGGGTTGGGTLTMDPGTCLSGGDVVTVSVAGFTPGTAGVFLECNSDPGQPTTDGNRVSCADPFDPATEPPDQSVGPDGTIGPLSLTTLVGTIGPPCAPWDCTGGWSPDSTGGNPTTDAAAYPCPPTPAQTAAGDTCDILFLDGAADEYAMLPLSYAADAGSATRSSVRHTRRR